MKFDTLYKRTRTGAIQYWKVETKLDDGLALICKESGQLGTLNPILHTESLLHGKQNRNYAEQADFQAESDWKKKKDEGYKSLSDLGLDPELDKPIVKPVDWPLDLQMVLDNFLPKFNTDAAGNVKPMLATDWKKIKKVEYPCYCEPKLDGVRCLMIVTPDESGEMPVAKFLSRSGKEYTSLRHIERAVQNAMDDLPIGSFILDGEVYSDELNFQEIVSAVKAYKPNSEKLHFRAYDIVNEDSQTDRRNALRPLVEAIGSEFIQHITWFVVDDEEEVKTFHDSFVQEGYEGAILRMFEGKYAQGSRSRELLKVKEFNENEYPIIGFEFGQRGVEDLIAVCTLSNSPLGFKAKMQGSLAQKIELYNKYKDSLAKSIGLLTVKHFGYTEDGIPRFPIGKSIRDYE